MVLPQKVSDYIDYPVRYKDKDVVYLNIRTEVMVDIGRSGLQIEERKFEETFYNNFKAGAFSEVNIQSSYFTKMKDVEASTLLPDDTKFKEIKVKKFKTKEVFDEDIFYQDLFSTSFIYPSLRQGAITRLKYTLDFKDPHFFPYVVLKKYYPVENFEFAINSDKDVVFDIKYFFTDTINIDFTKQEKGKRVIYTWKAKNLKSYKNEKNAPDYLCYLPQIVPYIKSYKVNNKEVPILRNIDDLFNWYNENISNLDHRHTDDMISTVGSIVKECRNDSEKVVVIYKWVQNNIKYVANEYGLGGFIPRHPYQIFEKRYGDCKDMATIIIELLDIADVKAYFTWIGTRDLPYSYEQIPTSLVDNHMIATYILNNRHYFLDATNSHNPMDLPSDFIQGKEGLIKKDAHRYEIIMVPEVPADTNLYSDTAYVNIDQGKVRGKGSLKLFGYYNSGMKHSIEKVKDKNDKMKFMKSYLEKGNNKYSLDEYTTHVSDKKFTVNYTFNISDYLKENGNEMYLNLNLSQPFDNFDLFKDDRKLPYEFTYKSSLLQTYFFTVPDGYEISYLPKNSEYRSNNFFYSVSYTLKGNQIIYTYSSKTDTMMLQPASFSDWNKMLKQMRSDFKEVVVLRKKTN